MQVSSGGVGLQSPEKLRQVVEETASAVEKERAALSEGERTARDLQARLEAISRVRLTAVSDRADSSNPFPSCPVLPDGSGVTEMFLLSTA